MPDDPTPDIYKAMDRAGLQASTFYNTRKSMDRIVLEVRMKLLEEVKTLIDKREAPGPQKGKKVIDI